jgi:trigger factor
MKVEYTDVSDTEKSLAVEIPSDIVGGEIDRVVRDYARSLRLPGFRPGKIPPKIIRQRFKAQILHDVAHDLIPRAMDDALRERGVEPIATPNVRDVSIEEGQPLKFTAALEIAPPVDPGAYPSLTIHRKPATVAPEQIDQALNRFRDTYARFQPVEDRGAETGDTVVMNMTRRKLTGGDTAQEADAAQPEGTEAAALEASGSEATTPEAASESTGGEGKAERLEEVGVEIGAPANPPGFDDNLLGVTPGTEKTFRVTFPGDYGVESLAGSELEYVVNVTGVRRKVLPELDDELAKDIGYDSLDALREQVVENLTRQAERQRDRDMRQEVLEQLARRVPFDPPEVLVTREVDRRVEEFVRQLIEQRVDPTRTSINWEEFREQQRPPAVETVKCMLVLDEIARRENLKVGDEEIDAQIAEYAESAGQAVETVKHRLEHEGAISRIYAGLRREKAIDFAITHATILEV